MHFDPNGWNSSEKRLTSYVFSQAASSPILWRELCRQTGKSKEDAASLEEEPSIDSDFYFRLYHRVLCVPVDRATITNALELCSPGTTITLLPGIYKERLVIDTSVRIRAADSERGAAILWYHPCPYHAGGGRDGGSSTCVCGHGQNESLVEVEASCTYVSLQNLTLLHYSEGTDLWHGNCAVYCHGDLTHTYLDRCSIQSDSGRGIVVSNGAEVIVARSTIHDCAATGVYMGDAGSSLDIITSNIIRNGYGRRPREATDGIQPRTPTIQAGHSGLYVEDSDCEIRNSLVAQNCLTGLSVVRDGNVHLCHNTFIGNGAEPVVIFQDEGENGDDHQSMGAVYEHSNVFDYAAPSRQEMESRMIRTPQVNHRPLSTKILHDFYNQDIYAY